MRTSQHTLGSIDGLRPHIIPHEQWPVHRWYSHTPLWYYHRPEPMRASTHSKQFYRGVDPELRSLCRTLHARGIHTGPSCQGHFHSREHLMRIWEQLRMEANDIRNGGLAVRDSETAKPALFVDSDFELPWPAFHLFYDEVSHQQSSGYLAMVLMSSANRLHWKLARKSLEHTRFSIELDDMMSDRLHAPLLHIHVQSQDPQERRQTWDDVVDVLNRSLL